MTPEEKKLWDEEMTPEYAAYPDAIWVSQFEFNWIFNSLPIIGRDTENIPGGWCAARLPDGRLLRSHPLMVSNTSKPNINRKIALRDWWPRYTGEIILAERTREPEANDIWCSQSEYNRVINFFPADKRKAAGNLPEGWEGFCLPDGRVLRVDIRMEESSVYEMEMTLIGPLECFS